MGHILHGVESGIAGHLKQTGLKALVGEDVGIAGVCYPRSVNDEGIGIDVGGTDVYLSSPHSILIFGH